MHSQRENRAPRQARGPQTNSATPSVRILTAPAREPVTRAEWKLYQHAAVTIYTAGEPVELTRARDELESWLVVAKQLDRNGTPALVPYLVAQALRYGGWVR